jgi:hypothetical protein
LRQQKIHAIWSIFIFQVCFYFVDILLQYLWCLTNATDHSNAALSFVKGLEKGAGTVRFTRVSYSRGQLWTGSDIHA